MRPDDRVRILHILDACESIGRFVAGRQRAELDSDELLLFGLIRAVEIVGEAASRVSDQTRGELPSVPWVQMSGIRNRLIHAYFDVNRDILWRTVTGDVPALMASLAPVRERK